MSLWTLDYSVPSTGRTVLMAEACFAMAIRPPISLVDMIQIRSFSMPEKTYDWSLQSIVLLWNVRRGSRPAPAEES